MTGWRRSFDPHWDVAAAESGEGTGGTLYCMRKTSIYLDPELDIGLTQLARARGVTKAEIIRQALREAVRNGPRPRITAIGVGEGPGNVAEDVDRHLLETGFGLT